MVGRRSLGICSMCSCFLHLSLVSSMSISRMESQDITCDIMRRVRRYNSQTTARNKRRKVARQSQTFEDEKKKRKPRHNLDTDQLRTRDLGK